MTCRVVVTHWSNGVSDIDLVNDTDRIGVWQSHPSASPEYARDTAEEQASKIGRIVGCPVEGHRQAAPQEDLPARPVPAPHRIAGIAYKILDNSPKVTVAQICDKAELDPDNPKTYLAVRDALDSQPGLARVHSTTGEWWEPR